MNLTVPALTLNDSDPDVGEITPDSMKMYVTTLKVDVSSIKFVLKVRELAAMPDTDVWMSSPKVKSVFANVLRL